ncbi:radical SAM protein [Candidatus Woesearchaeota archaeon]|jgi:uncharacterized protein|nr:radical SAM protein [Candidatus Woesearchaeota archaeon]MBT5740569.1 radical SAM protein [Candidatus Woesearchaeota archaeon]
MKINKYHSYNVKELPKGCQYCVKGEKIVLFVTGKCPRKCYFCPVSDEKYDHDVIFANEKKVNEIEDIINEAKKMQAKGAGITGGDPLIKLERTCEYIKKLKKEFGKQFHVHLYTSLNLVTKKSLEQLYKAGLDEIRFHLDFDDKKFWKKISLAKSYPWDIGTELPLLPDKETETKKIIDFIQDKVSFLNLNELERADNQQSKLDEMGLKVKEQYSYAIKNSLELGLKMINYVKEKKYSLAVHLCTAKLKDKIQLTNRIKREGKFSKRKFDIVDNEGLLTRGALYLKKLKPGFEYRKKLATINKEEFIKQLIPFYDRIKKKFKLEKEDIYLDLEKPRVLISKKLIKKKKSYFLSLGLIPAIVIEYPTADQLEIEIDFLH